MFSQCVLLFLIVVLRSDFNEINPRQRNSQAWIQFRTITLSCHHGQWHHSSTKSWHRTWLTLAHVMTCCLFHSYCIRMAGEYHAGDPFGWYRVQTGTQGGSFSSRGSSWFLFHSYFIRMDGEYHAGDPFRWYRVQTGTQGGSFSSRGSSWSQEACSWQGQSKKSSHWIFGSVDRVWPLKGYMGARIQSIWWPKCKVCGEIEELINSQFHHKLTQNWVKIGSGNDLLPLSQLLHPNGWRIPCRGSIQVI